MSGEWVELTDRNRKIVMTRRELSNLAHRVSRIFATAKPIKAPVDGKPNGRQVLVSPIFEAQVLRSPERHTGGNGDGATSAGPDGQWDKRRPQLAARQPL